MNGYMQIRVMAGGAYFDCWQQIEGSAVVAHVDDAGAVVTLPEVHEAYVLTKQMHYAPGVLIAPLSEG